MKKLIAIVLPMYNEMHSIPALRSMFDDSLNLNDCEYRLLLIDDGSTDDTLALARSWAEEDSKVIVVPHSTNMGLGQAVLTGLREALKLGAACMVTLDADGTHPAELINDLIEAVTTKGAEIAIASRFTGGGGQKGVPLHRQFVSFGARFFFRLMFPLKDINDYTTNFRAYKAEMVAAAFKARAEVFLVSRSFAATAELLLKMATLSHKIVEVPLVVRYDLKQSESKLRLLSALRDCLRLCLQPAQKCPLGRGLEI